MELFPPKEPIGALVTLMQPELGRPRQQCSGTGDSSDAGPTPHLLSYGW